MLCSRNLDEHVADDVAAGCDCTMLKSIVLNVRLLSIGKKLCESGHLSLFVERKLNVISETYLTNTFAEFRMGLEPTHDIRQNDSQWLKHGGSRMVVKDLVVESVSLQSKTFGNQKSLTKTPAM